MDKKTLIMAVGGLVLVGGVGAGAFMAGGGGKSAEPDMAAAEAPPPPPPEIKYFPMTPEFVVNFTQPSDSQFLMLDVVIATDNETVHELLDKHGPELRSDLLMLFSKNARDDLYTDQGKVALRQLAVEKVNEIVDKHYSGGEVKDLFFTRFVMQ